jgi:hypothetical protein
LLGCGCARSYRNCRQIAPEGDPLTLRSFLRFYIPLALTSLLTLLVQPIGSAALSRMPGALESLAVWPVVSGLLFLLRSTGIAYNEVVVALLGEPRAEESLRRFAQILALVLTAILLLIAATPLASLWFEGLSGLPPSLAKLAQTSLWFALLLPAFSVFQSWYQGSLVYFRKDARGHRSDGPFACHQQRDLRGGSPVGASHRAICRASSVHAGGSGADALARASQSRGRAALTSCLSRRPYAMLFTEEELWINDSVRISPAACSWCSLGLG